MTSAANIKHFLSGTQWNTALQDPLTADASNRRYIRLFDTQKGATALLMLAPPETETKTGVFIDVANWLRAHGFSAPDIYKANLASGLMLLEDFGQGSFAEILSQDIAREEELYELAGDVVCALWKSPPPSLPPYDTQALKTELDVFCDYWWPDRFEGDMPSGVRAAFNTAWEAPLQFLAEKTAAYPTVTLRDFHKDNLFELPARKSIARAGLIDFQDALIGHPAYDLVSLLQDARRDISLPVQRKVASNVAAQSKDPDFLDVYALLGTQRALKILGVFVRLDTVHTKPHYRAYLPRTWARVQQNLDHPMLADIKSWLHTHVQADGDSAQ
ncbi:MAG: phosphotransferase [Pseudomonadota bacterium]